MLTSHSWNHPVYLTVELNGPNLCRGNFLSNNVQKFYRLDKTWRPARAAKALVESKDVIANGIIHPLCLQNEILGYDAR